MSHLLYIRPSQGDSGSFQGPVDVSNLAHKVPGNAMYFTQNTLTSEWQDMYYPIYTRKIIDYQPDRKWMTTNSPDMSQPSPPIPEQYYRFRTRMN